MDLTNKFFPRKYFNENTIYGYCFQLEGKTIWKYFDNVTNQPIPLGSPRLSNLVQDEKGIKIHTKCDNICCLPTPVTSPTECPDGSLLSNDGCCLLTNDGCYIMCNQ